jgi:Protein of unknown function (DUF2795)
MEQQSDKHGPVHDEALKHEVEGVIRGGGRTRVEEWLDPEPPGEDQPDVDLNPEGTLVGGVPPGMTPEDVEERSELASYLGQHVYPARRDALIERLREQHAPDRLIDLVKALPADQEFKNAQEVAVALGLHVEGERF